MRRLVCIIDSIICTFYERYFIISINTVLLMLQVKHKRRMGNESREWLEAPTPNLQMQVFVKRFQIVLSQSKTTLTTLTRSPAFSVFFNQEKQTTQGVFATATVVRNLEKRFYLLKIPAGCLLLRYESNIKKDSFCHVTQQDSYMDWFHPCEREKNSQLWCNERPLLRFYKIGFIQRSCQTVLPA